MSAFLDLLNAYAIWIYILGVVGLLFAIKMLLDSRRQARTTMFTLEQEQASDQAFRAVLWMIGFAFLIGTVSAVNTFVAPARPAPIPPVAKQTAMPIYTPPVIPPTFTAVPTLTPEPPTAAPTIGPTATVTVQPSPSKPTPTVRAPTKAPTPAPTSPPPALIYPKPVLDFPKNGEHISGGWVRLLWGQKSQLPDYLPPGQFYRLTIQWVDHASGQAQGLNKCVQVNGWDNKNDPFSNLQGTSVDNKFTWFVVAVGAPDLPGCEQGGTPLSPQSDTSTFYWP